MKYVPALVWIAASYWLMFEYLTHDAVGFLIGTVIAAMVGGFELSEAVDA